MSDDKKKFSKLVLAERDNQELEMKVQEFLSDKVIVDESEYEALKDEIRRHEEVFQFSANRIAALKMEKDALREAYSLLRSFQISTVFDAKGTYAKQKSDEWYTITHQADALLTAEEQDDE